MNKILIPIIGLCIIIALLFSSLFVVKDGYEGIVTRFNKVEKTVSPGIHFKLPFIDKVVEIDTKINVTDNRHLRFKDQFQLKDNIPVNVTYYIEWKINQVERYYQWSSNQSEKDLFTQINDAFENTLKNATIHDFISENESNNDFQLNLAENVNNSLFSSSKFKNLLNDAGISIINIGISRLNFPEKEWDKIYQTLSDEKLNAKDVLAQTQKEVEKIKLEADEQSKQLLSKAKAEASRLKKEGDAFATEFYTKAYKQNKSFFLFFESLKMYETNFSENDILVIGPDSELARYLK